MGVLVQIDDPALVDDLVSRLARAGCAAHAVGDGTCHVVHVFAADAHEAVHEVRFFVNAWRLAHPHVSVSVNG